VPSDSFIPLPIRHVASGLSDGKKRLRSGTFSRIIYAIARLSLVAPSSALAVRCRMTPLL